jgi:hypothetical protein
MKKSELFIGKNVIFNEGPRKTYAKVTSMLLGGGDYHVHIVPIGNVTPYKVHVKLLSSI